MGFQVYTELLGFQFEKNDQLPRWHEEVKAFEVKEDGKAWSLVVFFLSNKRTVGRMRLEIIDALFFFFAFVFFWGGWRDIERLLLYVYVVLVFLVPFFQDFCDSRSGLGVSNVNRFAGHHKPTPPFCLGRWWVTSSWISSQGMASSVIR